MTESGHFQWMLMNDRAVNYYYYYASPEDHLTRESESSDHGRPRGQGKHTIHRPVDGIRCCHHHHGGVGATMAVFRISDLLIVCSCISQEEAPCGHKVKKQAENRRDIMPWLAGLPGGYTRNSTDPSLVEQLEFDMNRYSSHAIKAEPNFFLPCPVKNCNHVFRHRYKYQDARLNPPKLWPVCCAGLSRSTHIRYELKLAVSFHNASMIPRCWATWLTYVGPHDAVDRSATTGTSTTGTCGSQTGCTPKRRTCLTNGCSTS